MQVQIIRGSIADQPGARAWLMGELVPGPPAQLLDPAATYEAERHPLLTYVARLRPSGRRTQAAALQTLAQALSGGHLGALELPWLLLRYPHTAALRSWLAERYQVGTARTYLSALRGVLRECWRLELLGTDEYEHARDLEAVHGEVLPRGRSLSGGELRAIFEALADDERPIARRNACALVLLVGAGVRRAELAGLQPDQVDSESGRVEVREGKGRKDRVCWLPPSALPAVRDWLAVRGPSPGPLLLPVRKGGRHEDRALSAQAVRDLCRELTRLAAAQPLTPKICAGPGRGICSTPAATPRSWGPWRTVSRPIHRREPCMTVGLHLRARICGSPRFQQEIRSSPSIRACARP